MAATPRESPCEPGQHVATCSAPSTHFPPWSKGEAEAPRGSVTLSGWQSWGGTRVRWGTGRGLGSHGQMGTCTVHGESPAAWCKAQGARPTSPHPYLAERRKGPWDLPGRAPPRDNPLPLPVPVCPWAAVLQAEREGPSSEPCSSRNPFIHLAEGTTPQPKAGDGPLSPPFHIPGPTAASLSHFQKHKLCFGTEGPSSSPRET